LVTLIHELAEYERLSEQCIATDETVHAALFGPDPVVRGVLAFWDDEPAGYALFFRNFSTFLVRPGIYLEDLFVRPAVRGKGIGFELLRYVARYAVERDYRRVEWSVLRWNELAIDFYDRLGAERLDGWVTYRLAGEPLETLAAS
jgi:GNAT superfamily N-acetyltransferase